MDISHEGENYIRVSRLLVDEIQAQLRSFFKEKWKLTFPNEQEYDDTVLSGNILWDKITPKTRIRKKWQDNEKKIKGSTEEWDCTLLCDILLDGGITNDKGLKLVTPKDERDGITFFRNLRNNKLQHLPKSEKMSNDMMVDIFHNVRDAYKQLNWKADAIDAYENDKLKTEEIKRITSKLEEEKRAALRKNQGDFDNLPSSITHFIGREDETQKAVKALDNQDKCLLVHGGPCFGKSTLAIKVGHKMAVEKGYNYVVWINMRDISTPATCPSMDTLAEKILQEFQLDTSEMKDDILSYLTKKLSIISSSQKKALLIFDNADCLISNGSQDTSTDVYTRLMRLLKSKHLCNSIGVVFTSRISVTANDDDVHKIELRCLSSDESESYFKATLKQNTLIDRESLIVQLATLSHGLPLAMKILALKVNSMKVEGCLQDYLKDVEKSPAKTINEYREQRMFPLFDVSFKYMDAKEHELMKILAVFPSSFSYDYMRNLSKEVNVQPRLIDELMNQGMVEWQNPSFLIHPYMCEFVRQEKWAVGDKEMYEEAYACVYLKSLFELSRSSLEKDGYSERQNKFLSERHNFVSLMTYFLEQPKAHMEKESLSKLKGILKRPTSDYLAVRIFICNILRPNILISFFKDCEKLVANEMKQNIWCIRNELEVKGNGEKIEMPDSYGQADAYASTLVAYRNANERVHQFRRLGERSIDGNDVLNDLRKIDNMLTFVTDGKVQAYFNTKIWKLRAMIHQKMKDPAKAKEARETALRICDEAFGVSWLTFDAYEQLAKFYWAQKEHKNALIYFEKAESLAKQISLLEDERFAVHLLNKGRFLVSTGEAEYVEKGIILLEKSMELDPPGSRPWTKALDFLAQNDPKHYSKVISCLCSLKSPPAELLVLVTKKFKYEMFETERDTDEEVIKEHGLTAIDELKTAVIHLESILEDLEETKVNFKSLLQTSLCAWYSSLAKKTDHILLLEVRKEFAQKALNIAKTGQVTDQAAIKNAEYVIEQSETFDKSQEELLRRKSFLFKTRKLANENGMAKEHKQRFLQLLEDSQQH